MHSVLSPFLIPSGFLYVSVYLIIGKKGECFRHEFHELKGKGEKDNKFLVKAQRTRRIGKRTFRHRYTLIKVRCNNLEIPPNKLAGREVLNDN